MPRTALRFRETLGETSAQWCERNDIPAGFYVTLIRKSDSRQVRSDTSIHRRVLPKRADDDMSLKPALEDLQATFLTDLKQRQWDIKLRRPNRTNVDGKTQLGTIRNTYCEAPEEEDRISEQHDQISDCKNYFAGIGPNLEVEGYPEIAIIRGALKALVNDYGIAMVRRAAEAESIL
jgi:hypothetical protein